MVYVIQFCWQLVSRIRTFHTDLLPACELVSCQQTCMERPDPASKLSANLYGTSWSSSQAVSKPVRNVLIQLAGCQQTCMTYTIAVFTVKNSWWWTEELSETCRVLFPKQIWEISASSWVYYKNLSHIFIVNAVKLIHVIQNNIPFTFRLAIVRKGKGKDKVVLVHAMKVCGDLRYSSTNSESRR